MPSLTKLAILIGAMQRLTSLIIVAVSLIIFPVSGRSEQARIKNTLITNNKKELIVHFYVGGSFTPKIEEAIQSGIPTTFIYKIFLYNKAGESLGFKIVSKTISHTIKYDTLRKDYTVTMSETKAPVVLQDFRAAKELMARVDSLSLTTLDRLEKDKSYSLQVKAELDTIKLPPPLNYLFFFVSYWDFETAWETVEFTY